MTGYEGQTDSIVHGRCKSSETLMREQVEALKGRGSRAIRMGDALCYDQVQDEIQDGRYQFLALSFQHASQPPDEIEIKYPCMERCLLQRLTDTDGDKVPAAANCEDDLFQLPVGCRLAMGC